MSLGVNNVRLKTDPWGTPQTEIKLKKKLERMKSREGSFTSVVPALGSKDVDDIFINRI
jgi:hypothetical protein